MCVHLVKRLEIQIALDSKTSTERHNMPLLVLGPREAILRQTFALTQSRGGIGNAATN